MRPEPGATWAGGPPGGEALGPDDDPDIVWCGDCGRPEHIGGCRRQWDKPEYYAHEHRFNCDPGGGVYPGTRCSGMNCPVRWPVVKVHPFKDEADGGGR